MTVLTSRRAVLMAAAPVPGRLRLSDDVLRFDPQGGDRLEVRIADVQRIALRRRVLVITTADAEVRLRCFGVRGVAGLLVHARTR